MAEELGDVPSHFLLVAAFPGADSRGGSPWRFNSEYPHPHQHSSAADAEPFCAGLAVVKVV